MIFLERPIRRAQLISPWGVGAVVPFPEDESLMIAGLDMWDFGRDKSKFVIKDARLEKRLGVEELRFPPDFRDPATDRTNALIKIPAVRFPRWHYCPFCGTMSKAGFYSKQERCDGYVWPHGRSCSKSKFKRKLIPERFIVICPDGHTDDFPVMEWVHSREDSPPYEPGRCRLRRSTGGTSASLAGVFYECACGAKRNLGGATRPGALEKVGYRCVGAKPWLGIETDIENPCGRNDVKVVQRGGTNVWFADIRSSIYIPIETDETDRYLMKIAEEVFPQVNGRRVNGLLDKNFIDMIASFKKVDNAKLYKAIVEISENITNTKEVTEDMPEEQFRAAEYKVLIRSSGNHQSEFYSQNKKISEYHPILHNFFSSISLVPKLRETRALVGFSRLQPDESKTIQEKKKLLRLGTSEWLPAVQIFGEGVFFEFNAEALDKWVIQSEIQKRMETMSKSYREMLLRRKAAQANLNAKYVLIHSFAHLLINQLSYNCGYSSSSIRERIYCDRGDDENDMYGVLLYTATGDSEGSLGGLVRQGLPGHIEDIVISAILNAQWCSSDPVCIESLGQGPDNCNLAACHNCALLPETCCENGNRLLDRALVVGSLANKDVGFFNNMLKQ
jgi:hypothetical protein